MTMITRPRLATLLTMSEDLLIFATLYFTVFYETSWQLPQQLLLYQAHFTQTIVFLVGLTAKSHWRMLQVIFIGHDFVCLGVEIAIISGSNVSAALLDPTASSPGWKLFFLSGFSVVSALRLCFMIFPEKVQPATNKRLTIRH